MMTRLDNVLSGMVGFGARPQVCLRERPDGYVIETEFMEAPAVTLGCRIWCFVIVGLWAAALTYWLIVWPRAETAGPQPQFLISALLASGASLLWSMTRGARSYVVEVDLVRDQLRHGHARGGRAVFQGDPLPFSEIRDVVIARAPSGPAGRALCVRTRSSGRPIELARGDEATLCAVHDRVRHDLAPIEERLAGLHVRGLSKRLSRPAFAPLGPHEVCS